MAGFIRRAEEAEAKARAIDEENAELRGKVKALKAEKIASAGEHVQTTEKLRAYVLDLKKVVRTTEAKVDDGKLNILRLEQRATAAKGEQEKLRLEAEKLCRSNKELEVDLVDTHTKNFRTCTRQVLQKFPDSGIEATSLSVIEMLEEQEQAGTEEEEAVTGGRSNNQR